MLGYFSAGIVCSVKQTICELRGTDNVQEQISEHIFNAKGRLFCLLYFKYWGNIVPSFSWGIFSHVARLDQSRASENI